MRRSTLHLNLSPRRSNILASAPQIDLGPRKNIVGTNPRLAKDNLRGLVHLKWRCEVEHHKKGTSTKHICTNS